MDPYLNPLPILKSKRENRIFNKKSHKHKKLLKFYNSLTNSYPFESDLLEEIEFLGYNHNIRYLYAPPSQVNSKNWYSHRFIDGQKLKAGVGEMENSSFKSKKFGNFDCMEPWINKKTAMKRLSAIAELEKSSPFKKDKFSRRHEPPYQFFKSLREFRWSRNPWFNEDMTWAHPMKRFASEKYKNKGRSVKYPMCAQGHMRKVLGRCFDRRECREAVLESRSLSSYDIYGDREVSNIGFFNDFQFYN